MKAPSVGNAPSNTDRDLESLTVFEPDLQSRHHRAENDAWEGSKRRLGPTPRTTPGRAENDASDPPKRRLGGLKTAPGKAENGASDPRTTAGRHQNDGDGDQGDESNGHGLLEPTLDTDAPSPNEAQRQPDDGDETGASTARLRNERAPEATRRRRSATKDA